MHKHPTMQVEVNPSSPQQARFSTLDAMRGIAALAVVGLHFSNELGGYHPPLAWLAVDAFFVLSGFVIAYRYDPDFTNGKLNFRGFMGRRLLRLAPLYFFGLLIGLLAQIYNRDPGIAGFRILQSLIANGVGLPSPFSNHYGNFFPLNDPFWSLFFEFWIANLAYGLLWKHLTWPVLLAIIAISAVALCAVAASHGSLAGGYTWPTIHVGLARVGFSFFGGVALARRFRKAGSPGRIPSLLILCGLALVLVAPFGSHGGPKIQLLAILVLFPAMTLWGSGSIERFPVIGALLGDASYAAYAIHVPLINLISGLAKPGISANPIPYEIAFVFGVTVISVLAARIDTRVRRTIEQRLRARAIATVPSS